MINKKDHLFVCDVCETEEEIESMNELPKNWSTSPYCSGDLHFCCKECVHTFYSIERIIDKILELRGNQ